MSTACSKMVWEQLASVMKDSPDVMEFASVKSYQIKVCILNVIKHHLCPQCACPPMIQKPSGGRNPNVIQIHALLLKNTIGGIPTSLAQTRRSNKPTLIIHDFSLRIEGVRTHYLGFCKVIISN